MIRRSMTVIVNPRGGLRRGSDVLNRIRPVLTAAGIDLNVMVTTHAGHAFQIAREIDLYGCDGLCVVGGDGTLHEVADGLLQRGEPIRVPLGIIPAGTGNTVAQHLRCDAPLEAAQRIAQGQRFAMDVIQVQLKDRRVHCIDIVGWGAVSDINLNAERWRILGRQRYAAAALWQIVRARRRQATLMLDGVEHSGDFLFIIACNPKYTGAGMQLAPRAELNDGLMDVVVVRNASRWQMLNLFSKVFDGSHVHLKCVEYYQVRSFEIRTEKEELMNLDGEMKGFSPIAAEVLPSALSIFA
ncbi:MAG: diacylglycerol kinase family protein [Planctomycetaceae bacterium]